MSAYRRQNYQYKPALSRREAPRVSKRQRAAIDAICQKYEMPEADVLRYGLEAVILGVSNGELALQSLQHDEPWSGMVTIRLSRNVRPLVDKLQKQRRHLPTRAALLRACVDTMIGEEKKYGFAGLFAVREKFI